jgi:putative DNA primase/helicase
MSESIGDESIYLRMHELSLGMLQFTDSTNAYRLLKEHGKDIRYNMPWKKWLVWNGCQWELDKDYLIHDRGLKMVRSIYAELLKTSDYRDRLDIENTPCRAKAHEGERQELPKKAMN